MCTYDFSESVEDVLNAANHIQLLPVVDACVNYLKSNISLSCCVDIATLAEVLSLDDLKHFAYTFISKNFQSLSTCSDFMKLSSNQLLTLLQNDFPLDCQEFDVFSAVIGWCFYHHGNTASSLLPFLPHINFKSITSSELETMHNHSALQQMCSDSVYGNEIDFFTRKIVCSKHMEVSGLMNLRGYEKSLVVAGGFEPGKGMSNDIRYFSKSSRELKVLTTVPHVEQCNFGMTVLNNTLYVIGGCYNDEQMTEIVHGYGFAYSPLTGTWTDMKPMIDERCRFYLGAVDNKLYAIGGDPSASSVLADTAPCECYDPSTNSWSAIAGLPGNRMQHAGVVMGTSLFISGGLQDAEGPTFNTFFCYDTLSNTWTQLPAMPSARADHSMFVYDNKIYVIGGWYEDNDRRVMEKNIDCYDPELNTWSTIDVVSMPRLYATYNIVENRLFVVGGWFNGDYQQKCSSIQVYDLDSKDWQEFHENVCEIWEHASCNMYLPINKQTCHVIV